MLSRWAISLGLEIIPYMRSKCFIQRCKTVILWNGSAYISTQFLRGKYKTWTPGPWTPCLDWVHGPPLWTGAMDPSMDRVHGPPPWAAFFQISILLLNMIRVFNF
jgi:hypothetical protein